MSEQAYKSRYNSVKQRKGGQLTLFDTDGLSSVVAVDDGVVVNNAEKRRAEWWLADCAQERTATENLMDSVTDTLNLKLACERVISNGGSGGVDGMTTEELKMWFSKNYENLQDQLLEERYRPKLVRGVKIPKANGGERQLGIPTVVDRVIQQSIQQVLSPRYEKTFSEYSYGFRPHRGAHDALHQASEYISEGKTFIVDMDMAKFFDEVNHDRLLWLLSRRIGDKRLLRLIRLYLQSGILEGGMTSQRIKGTPQGGPLSPLLSNIVLDELDKELEKRGHSYVRYADDIIIMVKSEKSAMRVISSIIGYVEGHLRLRVNRKKSAIRKGLEVNFLGHSFGKRGRPLLSKTSERRLKEKIRKRTQRNRGVSFQQVINELNDLIRGWLSYFRFSKMKRKLRTIESWIRRRLRCYRLKQCKRAIGIHRFLKRLGVQTNRSWTTASNRRGWWVKAITPSAHEGMNNEWFANIGLTSLSKLYARLHT